LATGEQMKKLLLLLLIVSTTVQAGQLDETVSVVTDYRFRGISQSNLEPSLANQLEYKDDSGLWVGNKLNTVSKQEYTNGLGTEADIYGGWHHQFSNDVRIFVGDYEYTYAGATQFNTNEVFAQIRFNMFTVKYYRSTTDYFNVPGTVGTQYFNLDNYMPIGNITLISHVGRTVSPVSSLSYTDWRIGPTINLEGIDFSATYYWNSGMSTAFKDVNTVDNRGLYRQAVVFSVSKSF
jgi:uncharacterized protein (TIGR02001 family)